MQVFVCYQKAITLVLVNQMSVVYDFRIPQLVRQRSVVELSHRSASFHLILSFLLDSIVFLLLFTFSRQDCPCAASSTHTIFFIFPLPSYDF